MRKGDSMSLITVVQEGLYCEQGDFYRPLAIG